MASDDKESFISECRTFFDNFPVLMSVNDPLPVKVGGYSINYHEIDGEVVDWSLQYLQQRNCPARLLPRLITEVLQNVRAMVSSAGAKEIIEESSEKGFPPIRLMHLVIAELNKVCLNYQDNQQFEKICGELTKNSNIPQMPTSVYAIKNTRRKMEDRHVILQDVNAYCGLSDQVARSYYAVFDGHAGTDAAFYAAAQLYQYLVKNPHFHSDISLALKESFTQTDSAFIQKNQYENLKGGTTAVIALVHGNMLSVAWLGDSQAILVRDGTVTSLVNVHKPDRQDEMKRIADMGGEVFFWDGAYRVNGQLAVSRAIGDTSYKPYVTADPDVVSVPLDGNEDFLVLACDGLWDTIGLQEAAFLVHQHLHHSPDDLPGVSTRLVQAAKQKGSTDNISVIVVFFRDPAEIARRPLPAAPETPPLSPVSPSSMEEQQQRQMEQLAVKWGWEQSQGAVLFDQTPFQQPDPTSEAPGTQSNGHETSVLNPEAQEFQWNQYDEEMSGQPSLMCWDQNEQQQQSDSCSAAAGNGEDLNQVEALQSADEALRDEVDRSEPLEPKESVPFNWNISAPEFEFNSAKEQEASGADPELLGQPALQPRKLSAAEVLARSANDAELAVLLAAANDDPDEENIEGDSELAANEEQESQKFAAAEEQTLLPETEGQADTTYEEGAVDDSEDDWTYYRGEDGQEEGEEKMDQTDDNSLHECMTPSVEPGREELTAPALFDMSASPEATVSESVATAAESNDKVPESIIDATIDLVTPLETSMNENSASAATGQQETSRTEGIQKEVEESSRKGVDVEPALASEAVPETANVDSQVVELPEQSTVSKLVPQAGETGTSVLAASEQVADDAASLVSDTGATVGSEIAALGALTLSATAAVSAAAGAAAKAAKKTTSPLKKPAGSAVPGKPRPAGTAAAAKKPEVKPARPATTLSVAPKATGSPSKAAAAVKAPTAATTTTAAQKKTVPSARPVSAAPRKVPATSSAAAAGVTKKTVGPTAAAAATGTSTKPSGSSLAKPTANGGPSSKTASPVKSPSTAGAAVPRVTSAAATRRPVSGGSTAAATKSAASRVAAAPKAPVPNGDAPKTSSRPTASRPAGSSTAAASATSGARPKTVTSTASKTTAPATSPPKRTVLSAAAKPSNGSRTTAAKATASPQPKK